MSENFNESPGHKENDPFEEFNFLDFPGELNVEGIVNEKPTKVALDFRKPFGEGTAPRKATLIMRHSHSTECSITYSRNRPTPIKKWLADL